jgi:hypothetical protein
MILLCGPIARVDPTADSSLQCLEDECGERTNFRVARDLEVSANRSTRADLPLPMRSRLNERLGDLIGIGAAVARGPLPHHRAYGSVHGGSSQSR